MSGQTRRKRDHRSSVNREEYISGNAVRKYNEGARERIQRERTREEEREKRRKQNVARRNQEKAMQMGAGYVFFCTLALALTCLVCVAYIQLQSDMTSKLKQIAKLESQIADIKADNDAAVKRINTSTDLESIKNTAINDLKMRYASNSQIVYYSVDNADYMNQYSDIPQD